MESAASRAGTLALFVLVVAVCTQAGAQQDDPAESLKSRKVAALGRLEPRGGIVHIAATSTPLSLAGSVIDRLLVSEGDDVVAGQLLAVTDAEPALEAALKVAEAQLALQVESALAAGSKAEETCVLAEVQAQEAERRANLLERQLASTEEAEQSRGQADALAASCKAARSNTRVSEAAIEVARAELARRQAELERARVLAPFDGRVLRITAEPGEYVGPDGFLELGRVQEMMAIAEVYETEIRYVRVGQAAEVSSDALSGPKQGRVAFIRPKVQKQDEIGTDPAARKDARIVEVGVRLDDPGEAMSLTNLQVEVVITP